jgi:hypothetical protein
MAAMSMVTNENHRNLSSKGLLPRSHDNRPKLAVGAAETPCVSISIPYPDNSRRAGKLGVVIYVGTEQPAQRFK